MLSRRVLIIEDDADAAGVLEAYLRRENFSTKRAFNNAITFMERRYVR